ncbi:MAG: serine hydrolase [Bacteroidales bacterium]|nr:serine hydrolase [Bacteroidales bacterium]
MKILFAALLTTLSLLLHAQNAEIWADSVLKTLTIREKIGQLIMMEVYSNQDGAYEKSIDDSIKKYQPGTIVFFQGSPQKEAQLTNRWQKLSKIPMLVAMDAEWGLAMRLDSVIALPRLMALSATNDTNLVFQYGKAIGKQCKRLGININFAPVVDINNNPINPVINYRSFGENQHKVAKFAEIFCKGMQSEGVLAVIKHFPGHGNTSLDSHHTLPDVTDNAAVVDSVHLHPFKSMIKSGVWGIMVAHVFVPAIDTASTIPTSLNKNIINGILRKKLNYNGIVITDGLGMQGVLKHHKPGKVEVMAILAGNDALLMPKNINTAFDSILDALNKNIIDSNKINESVRKILITKYNCGILKQAPITEKDITADLNDKEYLNLKSEIYKKNTTLVFSKNTKFPLTNLKKVAVLSLNASEERCFHKEFMKYFAVDNFFINDDIYSDSLKNDIISKLKEYDLVIAAMHNMAFWTKKNYNFTKEYCDIVEEINNETKTILCLFGNPYAYRIWSSKKEPEALITTYERDSLAEMACAKSMAGVFEFNGTLPVSINDVYKAGSGMKTNIINDRLYEVSASELNLDISKLDSIDLMIKEAIDNGLMPGCQILAALNGKVFYNKSFGYHDYLKETPVKPTDLYDLASITKIFSTTLAVMKLWEEKRFQLDDKLEKHLPISKNTAAGNLHLDRLLTHSSGLQAWIPFYKKTLENNKPSDKYYRNEPDSVFGIKICDSLYLRNDYPDTILHTILNARIKSNHDYVYSDLGIMLLKEMVEHLSNSKIDNYVEENFYIPLGLSWMTYNPSNKFHKTRIIPTEEDTTFRKTKVQGYVHDQAAAMLGGVSGHAGLFGNAWDAATIMQMLLNGGKYADVEYFKPSTIRLFTSTYFDRNRRGLGFDKPSSIKDLNACPEASPYSFGHSGFTGTYAWADPTNGLVYIFLSNRTYPDAENRKLMQQNIRTRVHTLLYEAVDNR